MMRRCIALISLVSSLAFAMALVQANDSAQVKTSQSAEAPVTGVQYSLD